MYSLQMKTQKSSSSSSRSDAFYKENKHLSKDGQYYDTYQLMVAANIRFNKARLKEKGLDQSSFAALKSSASTKTKSAAATSSRRRRKKKQQENTPVAAALRRSNRKRNAPPENNGLDEMIENAHHSSSFRTKKARRRKTTATTAVLLTAEQRSKLLQNNNNWLREFETYLLQEEGVSLPNCRSVLRQVEKLVSGAGITYAHWGENVCFQKDCAIKLSDDFGKLFQQAVDFEEEHGRDLGNGWLMRHPIRKLENFQRFCHEKNAAN